MGHTLKKFLIKKKGYVSVSLESIDTLHFILSARVNGKSGRFILDTGASNTCIGENWVDYFELIAERSEIRAAGAGTDTLKTQTSVGNSLQIGDVIIKKQPLLIFDLSHINRALAEFGAEPVQGIIGADILLKKKAVIDYAQSQLYLQRR